MRREVEMLGNAGNYHGQGQAFLAGTGAIIEARFLKMAAGHFDAKDEARDIWEIRISRNGRTHTFQYGTSIRDTEERLERIAGPQRSETGAYMRTRGIPGSLLPGRIKKWEENARAQWVRLETIEAMQLNAPHAYDILSGLTKYEPPQDVDEFAAEYGYEKPSQALKIHRAVLEEYAAMQKLFTDEELEIMGLIS